jgi:hypothetical protein
VSLDYWREVGHRQLGKQTADLAALEATLPSQSQEQPQEWAVG